MTYIRDLKENQTIMEHYYCQEKMLCKAKSGKDYLSLVLRDKTGTIGGKVWEITPDSVYPFEAGDMVKVAGHVSEFKGEKQLNIQKIRKSLDSEVNVAEYSPTTEKSIEEMLGQIDDWKAQVQNPYLRQVLEAFYGLSSPYADKIRVYPAAKTIHHSQVGGYLEHVTSVTKIALFLSEQYKNIDQDLVVTACLLHDIGKLRELEPMPSAAYTLEGQLLGHIAMGYQMVHDFIATVPDFPKELGIKLEHTILAHHGKLEFGSPKLPMLKEALIVHLADDVDAKLKQVEEFMEHDTTEGDFTARNYIMERNFYKG